MSAEERNKKAKDYVHKKLQEARSLTLKDFSDVDSDAAFKKTLNDLIFVKANGFRGIALTAIVGLYLNPEYDPLNDFYACSPRAIFEQGIWYALNENGIPSGKSDPLNVAKNISVIDENWTKGKRPESAALAAVMFLRALVASKNTKKYNKIVDYFFFQLDQYAKSVAAIEIKGVSGDLNAAQSISRKLIDFTLRYPESGTIPQFVIGNLIKYLYEGSSYEVGGVNESVFGTNTTSKKPADIWVLEDGIPVNLYEITVKKIDGKRLDDCLDALQKLDILNIPVTFICRVPVDTKGVLADTEGLSEYKGKPIYVVDISNFITVTLSLLTQDQIDRYMQGLVEFLQSVNRPVATKEGWKKIFGDSEG